MHGIDALGIDPDATDSGGELRLLLEPPIAVDEVDYFSENSAEANHQPARCATGVSLEWDRGDFRYRLSVADCVPVDHVPEWVALDRLTYRGQTPTEFSASATHSDPLERAWLLMLATSMQSGLPFIQYASDWSQELERGLRELPATVSLADGTPIVDCGVLLQTERVFAVIVTHAPVSDCSATVDIHERATSLGFSGLYVSSAGRQELLDCSMP